MSQTRGHHSTLIKGKTPHEFEELISEKEDERGRSRFIQMRDDYHSPHSGGRGLERRPAGRCPRTSS